VEAFPVSEGVRAGQKCVVSGSQVFDRHQAGFVHRQFDLDRLVERILVSVQFQFKSARLEPVAGTARAPVPPAWSARFATPNMYAG
jgi:hypothetical protein